MDSHDAAFVGDAGLEAGPRSRQTVNGKDYSAGRDATIAVGGGLDEPLRTPRDTEDTPLLRGESPSPSKDREDDEPRWSGQVDVDALPWRKRPSVYWMLPPFLLHTLAFGGIIVPKLNLILTLICREYMAERSMSDPCFTVIPVIYGEDNPQCRIPEVQSRVAQFTLYGTLIGGLLSAFTSPKLGALSDRYGRKRILTLTSFGTFAGEVITILAATYSDSFHVNWILVGYALDGLCGSFTAAMAIAYSYASDCTAPNRRNVAFGYFHGCLFSGIALGPIIAGYIIKWTGSVLVVFYIALGAHIIFILLILFVIPESLSKSRQLAAREKHRIEREAAGPASDWINQIRSLNVLEPLKILYPTGEGSSSAVRRNLVLLSSIDTIVFGVAMSAMTIIVIYSNYQFGWGNFESSVFMSTVNICRVFCLLVVLPVLTRLVRGPSQGSRQRNSGADRFDLSIIRIAVFFDTLGYLGYTLSRTGPLFILSGALGSIGGIGSPTLQSSLTKHVPPDRTGQLLGASGLLHALARVAGPTIFNAIYSVTVADFPQTVFVCLTAGFAIAFALSWFVRPNVYLNEPDVLSPGNQSGEATMAE